MNAKLGKRIIEISRALKPQKETGKSFHVTAITKKNRIICVGWNDYQKNHPSNKFGKYENHKKFPTEYKACRHSEISAILRFGEEDLSDYNIVNVRVGNDGNIRKSTPCVNCTRVLSQLLPRKIFYTNDSGEFEQMAM